MSEHKEAHVEITLSEIYRLQLRMLEELHAYQSSLDITKANMVTVKEDVRDLSQRLREVEVKVWAIPSAAVVFGLAGLVISIIQLVTR